jgi:hydrogenase expression/formation protein HypE
MTQTLPIYEGLVCPLPLEHSESVMIGHGSGGKMTQDLIQKVFQTHFHSPELLKGNDFASVFLPKIPASDGNLIVSTDSHIVTPLFFPGGDIGRLAVCGTVNDVSMSGATPLYLTAAFIIEEGFSVNTLEKIIISMAQAAEEAGVIIIAGDTKVAEKGKIDQLFINTTGIGWKPQGIIIDGEQAKPGDVVLISGSMGDHGTAVLTARGSLGFQTNIQSDTAPLNHLIREVLTAVPDIHVLRDPTRGGLATTLNEIAHQSHVSIHLEEDQIPVTPPVRAVCDMLGFDPLYIANEGKVIVIIPPDNAELALSVMRKNPYGSMAMRIGMVLESPKDRVLLHTSYGSTRILDTLAGEILPRIC